MDTAINLITVSAGLLLSLSCALLLEELIFGGLFRLFFSPRAQTPATRQPVSDLAPDNINHRQQR